MDFYFQDPEKQRSSQAESNCFQCLPEAILFIGGVTAPQEEGVYNGKNETASTIMKLRK